MPAPVQFQPIAVGYPQPQAPRVPVQDLGVAAPAERLRPYLRGDRDASKVKMEKTLLSSDDEKVLVDALKAGNAQGLTMGEVVDRLQKVRLANARILVSNAVVDVAILVERRRW